MILFADFETYWSKDYTLRSMTPAEYILDPRFQVHGCAFQWGEGAAFWLDGHQLPSFFRELPRDTVVVTFNALFDMCIVYWRYGYIPALMLDAMGMARACIGPNCLRSFSLSSVAKHLGIGHKGDAVEVTMGIRTENMPMDMYNNLVAYAKNDVDLTRHIFNRLAPQFPPRELRFMDAVLRCTVTPQLSLDPDMLQQHIADIQAQQKAALDSANCDRIQLMSTAKFKELLESYGVVVESKISPTTHLPIPALARTDEFMQDLYYNHPDPKVQALVAARMTMKSTIEETRAKRLYSIAMLPWSEPSVMRNGMGYMEPPAPIPLRYAGAHTHRLSGDWKINLQNLPRGSRLRKALRAPAGCKVISADLAQIEARLGAWFAGEENLLGQFRRKEDPYSALASYVFGMHVSKETHPVERFIGKTGILGLGYGAGYNKFHKMVNQQARAQLGRDIQFPITVAEKTVNAYRYKLYPNIPAKWEHLASFVLPALCNTRLGSVELSGGVYAQGGHITLPNGLRLHYHIKERDKEYVNVVHGVEQRIYGAKLMENIIQALARIVLSEAALRLQSVGLQFCMQVHDELIFVVEDSNRELGWATGRIRNIMTAPPEWAPDLPLDVDIHMGDTYGDCK